MSLLASHSLGGQDHHDALCHGQPPGHLQIALDVLREHPEIPEHLLRLHDDIIREDAHVGENEPFCRGVGKVPLVPLDHVLHGRGDESPDHPGKSGDVLAGDGVLLVGHGGTSYLLLHVKALGDLKDLASLEVPDLGGELLQGGRDVAQDEDVFRVPVPLHDLGRCLLDGQPELFHNVFLDAEGVLSHGCHGPGGS